MCAGTRTKFESRTRARVHRPRCFRSCGDRESERLISREWICVATTCDPNAYLWSDRSTINVALIGGGNDELVEEWIDRGPGVDTCGKDSETALRMAAKSGREESVFRSRGVYQCNHEYQANRFNDGRWRRLSLSSMGLMSMDRLNLIGICCPEWTCECCPTTD